MNKQEVNSATACMRSMHACYGRLCSQVCSAQVSCRKQPHYIPEIVHDLPNLTQKSDAAFTVFLLKDVNTAFLSPAKCEHLALIRQQQ